MNGKKVKQLRNKYRIICMKNNLQMDVKGMFRKVKKTVKSGIVVIGVMFVCQLAYADRLIISSECEPQELQKEFKKNNLILDLPQDKKTKFAFGLLENNGAGYVIKTYKPVTDDQLEIVKLVNNAVLEETYKR